MVVADRRATTPATSRASPPTEAYAVRRSWRAHVGDLLAYAWIPQLALARLRGCLYRLRYAFDQRVHIAPGLIAEAPFRISGPGRVEIGHGVKLRRSNAMVVSIRTLTPAARVKIGDGSELGGVQILCGREVTLGEQTLAAACRIQDVDFANPELDGQPGRVRVGRGAWIAISSVILKGASIGDWAIVGAGSVVQRPVCGLGLAMGNPARSFRGVIR